MSNQRVGKYKTHRVFLNKNKEIVWELENEKCLVSLSLVFTIGYLNTMGYDDFFKRFARKLYIKYTTSGELSLSEHDKKVAFYTGLGQLDYKFVFNILNQGFLPPSYLCVVIEPLLKHLSNFPSNKHLHKSLEWVLTHLPIHQFPTDIIPNLLRSFQSSFYLLKFLTKYFSKILPFHSVVLFENITLYNKKMFIGCAAKEFEKRWKKPLPIFKFYHTIIKRLERNINISVH
jgi:hypothetical protein